MKIGDRVFVHGYIDEIRKDTVIIHNNGGYFGTVPSEVIVGELPSAQHDKDLIHLQKEQAYMQGYEDGQKPRKGKWIYSKGTGYGNPYGHYECDLCGNGYGYKTNFCPTCGADMRGDSE